ncbi:lecithin retinol acyltransferase-like isoform X2 [Corticium candelabrum]|uniref:lecithin retinol acyltransferase-like isoform X2 n=1 Tax=Corticium candelabrum TaxID=121492 RepID=UPI002E258899|nr:lecithin retinol acyltransferase-like isoform X2 [Corticium candelabrum]
MSWRLLTAQLDNGDHVSVNCLSSVDGSLASLYHHGIYNDGCVYHFSGDTKRDASLKESTIEDFRNGRSDLRRINYDGQSCYNSQQVVERAKELVRNGAWPGYQPLSNNCEHFATYCKTGIPYSSQVNDICSSIIKSLDIISSIIKSLIKSLSIISIMIISLLIIIAMVFLAMGYYR